MILIALLKALFFVLLAFFSKTNLKTTLWKWILASIIFIIVYLFEDNLASASLMVSILWGIVIIGAQVMLIMTLFNFKIVKAYIFKLSIIVFFAIPELIIPSILHIGYSENPVSKIAILMTNSILFIIAYVLLFVNRGRIQFLVGRFNHVSEEISMGLLVVAINCDWYLLFSTLSNLDIQSEGDFILKFYTFIIGSIVINLIPVYFLLKLYKQMTTVSRSFSISIAKNLLNDYFKQSHDLNNIAQVLNLKISSDKKENDSIVNEMIDLKTRKASKSEIQLDFVDNSIKSDTQPKLESLFNFDSLDLAIITGIFLDNAIEYLNNNPRLDRRIDLSWNRDILELKVTNSISCLSADSDLFFFGGKTSKKDQLLSGYGLTNAKELAERIDAVVGLSINDQKVSFYVTPKP